MSDFVDHLCFKHTSGIKHLCYKHPVDGITRQHLIYKQEGEYRKTWAKISITWYSRCDDIDICGYWTGRTDAKIGYGYADKFNNGLYRSFWDGDITTEGGTEVIWVAIFPTWNTEATLTYKVHLNAFGYDSETAPYHYVSATVSSEGRTIVLNNINAGARTGEKALVSDPGFTVSFNQLGWPLSITPFS